MGGPFRGEKKKRDKFSQRGKNQKTELLGTYLLCNTKYTTIYKMSKLLLREYNSPPENKGKKKR